MTYDQLEKALDAGDDLFRRAVDVPVVGNAPGTPGIYGCYRLSWTGGLTNAGTGSGGSVQSV